MDDAAPSGDAGGIKDLKPNSGVVRDALEGIKDYLEGVNDAMKRPGQSGGHQGGKGGWRGPFNRKTGRHDDFQY